MAAKLHEYAGLPVDYLVKANLRVSGGMFEHELQANDDITTGRLDTRFAGPSLDPLSKESQYDPQSSAIELTYVAAFNDYVRKRLVSARAANTACSPTSTIGISRTSRRAPTARRCRPPPT